LKNITKNLLPGIENIDANIEYLKKVSEEIGKKPEEILEE